MPRRPPNTPFSDEGIGAKKLGSLLTAVARHPSALLDGKYLHWDEVRHREPPEGLDHKMWWWSAKVSRTAARRSLPLRAKDGSPFSFVPVDPMTEVLHFLDQHAGGSIELDGRAVTTAHRDRFIFNSLVEEAVRSSQIEGALTTREQARQMIRSGRRPRTRSERMVLNNFETMQRIMDLRQQPLTPSLVFEIQRRITDGTLKNPDAAGRLRRPDETWVVVEDDEGNDLHVPPPADELPARMEQLCQFANGEQPKEFLHPAIRAMTLHFVLAYDHPFCDGNGRTARALFYWCMLRHGYWLFEFLSISAIIQRAKKRYGQAFLFVETDDNDLTYFLLYHLEVVRRSVDAVRGYIARKVDEMRQAERQLGRLFPMLNHRQQALIQHAIRHPAFDYTIESHQRSHGIVYQTARTDLLQLSELGLLTQGRRGKRFVFSVPSNLPDRLAEK